ncbi:MAG: DNA alkylation repair protein [Patescibacteria group bacterium]|nr:DNA alkylation repair protein [Patescibacteria group bacterium]
MQSKPPIYRKAHEAVLRQGDPKRAATSQRFFKTGPGEYGAGDVFIGLTAPQTRELAKEFFLLSLADIEKLLHSKIHEERQLALFILVRRYEKNVLEREKIYRFYLDHTRYVNNWDLVDLSAYKIVGRHLFRRSIGPLEKFARSSSLWERRIAIVSTFQFIRRLDFEPTLKIVRMLMRDRHDLIHKACGWMLREVGKRDMRVLHNYLKHHHRIMPRVMLYYTLERFPRHERKRYLSSGGLDF